MMARRYSATARYLALIAMIFGASVGLGNAFLGNHHDQHYHGAMHSIVFNPQTCVFCLDGMAPCPVESFDEPARKLTEVSDFFVPETIASPFQIPSVYRSRAPPAPRIC